MESENGASNQAPLGALFERYAPTLRRMLGTRGPQGNVRRISADKDDLVQEAFLCALATSRRTPTLFVTRGYLFTIARNLDIDGWRRRQSQVSVELDGGSAETMTVCPEALMAEREQRAQAEALSRYVERLPSALGCVYETRFVRGLSQRHAAGALGISRRQLRTLEQRLFAGAMRELRGGNSRALCNCPAE